MNLTNSKSGIDSYGILIRQVLVHDYDWLNQVQWYCKTQHNTLTICICSILLWSTEGPLCVTW